MELAAAFDAHVAAEGKVEPKDWMPEAYRKTLVRQISQHAHSEIIGMQPEGNWLTRAPSLRRKAILLAKVQDEAGHGLYLYAAAETLGTSRERDGRPAARRHREVLEHLQLPDTDLGRHRRDRLAGRRRRHHEPGPAVPLLLRSLRARDEADLQGGVLPPAAGLRHPGVAVPRHAPRSNSMAQEALDRWWWPSLMMFGPNDDASPNSAQSMRWRIKRFSNDELRQRFVDATVPAGAVPRPARPRRPTCGTTRPPATGEFGEIDWEEFRRVLAGDGPMNAAADRPPPRALRRAASGCSTRQRPTPPSGAAEPAA